MADRAAVVYDHVLIVAANPVRDDGEINPRDH
jgi:hypothetical protein